MMERQRDIELIERHRERIERQREKETERKK